MLKMGGGGCQITHSSHDEQCSALVNRRNCHSHTHGRGVGKASLLFTNKSRCAATRSPPGRCQPPTVVDSTACRLQQHKQLAGLSPGLGPEARPPRRAPGTSAATVAAAHAPRGRSAVPRPDGAGQRSQEASRYPGTLQMEPERALREATNLTPGSPHCRRS